MTTYIESNATTTNNSGTATKDRKGYAQLRDEVKQVDHLGCVDRILEIPGDPEQAGALFNLLLKIGQSPAARLEAMNHIRNAHMMKSVLH